MTAQRAEPLDPSPGTRRPLARLPARRLRVGRGRSAPRPPFENRFGDGEQGWRWYVELETLGPAYVQARLAQQDALADVSGLEAFDVDVGFAHDWLAYRARRERLQERQWRWLIAGLAAVAAAAALVAAIPVLQMWVFGTRRL